jgi:acetyl-CoA acetyltransferase
MGIRFVMLPFAREIGGTMPVNTDGGCLANGEPIGASGLRQGVRERPAVAALC